MQTDVVTVPATSQEQPGARATPADAGLTRRASLNAVASLIDYVVKIAVHLMVTPILVSGLGRVVYGVWEVLHRFIGYMSATDGRATEALRLVVAQHHSKDDQAVMRRSVGAALVVWVLLLPVAVLVGAVFLWLAPRLASVPPGMVGTVRLAGGLLIAALILRSLSTVPESVLRGMNLAYKRMGVQAGLNVLAGGFMAVAVLLGLGLAGLGLAQALAFLATGLCFLLLTRRFVGWFGASRPESSEVRTMLGMSLWLAGGELIAKVLLASDVVILGALVGPATVATYALTGYATRAASGIHIYLATAAIPGLGGLLGRNEHDRAVQVRRELLLLTWLFATVVGVTILLWNRSFVLLWVGQENYAGGLVNLLLVLLGVQAAFIRTDAYVIDAALRPKSRVRVGAVAAVVMVAAATLATMRFGLVGLCFGLLAGRMVQTVAHPRLARASLGGVGVGAWRSIRLSVVMGLLFAAALVLGEAWTADGWLRWMLSVAATVPVATLLAFFLGLDGESRRDLVRRLLSARTRGRAA